MCKPLINRWLLLVLVSTSYIVVIAQSEDNPAQPRSKNRYDYEQILSADQWNFFIRPTLVLNVPYHFHQNGMNYTFSSTHPDLAVGWMYQRHLPQHWGLETGLAFEQQWDRDSWQTNEGPNPFINPNVKTLFLPVYAVYRLPLYDKHNSWLLNFKFGLDIRYSFKFGVEDYAVPPQYGPPYINDFSSNIWGKQSINPAFHAAIGSQYILPNKHLLELSLSYTAAPFYRQSEVYFFYPSTPQQVSGSFSRSYSYLGFEINYVFTNVRRMKAARRGYIGEKPPKEAKAPKYYDYEQIYSTSHWNFFVQPGMAISRGYDFHYSGLDLKLRPIGTSVIFGWMYQFNFKKWWGIQTGIHFEMRWFSFNYSNPESYNGIRADGAPQTLPANGGGIMPSLPVYAVYRHPLYDKHNSWLLNFRLGASLRYIPSSWSEYSSSSALPGSTNNYEFVDIYTINPDLIDVVLRGSAGVQYILPNKRLLEISIVGSYAPMFKENFSYTFSTGTPQQVSGGFSEHYGYLGIEINYVFTRVRHMKPAQEGYTIEPIFKPKIKKKGNQSLPNIN